MLTDWRGNVYKGGAPLGVICSVDTCTDEAVRHPCNAENDVGRTHWHGEVHDLSGGGPKPYCAKHGKTVLVANEAARARRKGTMTDPREDHLLR